MKVIYVILRTAGWVWLALAMLLLWLRLRSLRKQNAAHRFDRFAKHDQ